MRKRLTIAIVLWIAGLLVFRYALVPPEACGPVDLAAIDNAIGEVRAWLEDSQGVDGTYIYEYDRVSDELSRDYNMVRHAGVTMGFYQMAADGDPTAVPVGDNGLAFMLNNVLTVDDRAYLTYRGPRAELGSSALMLAGLAHRRQATEDRQYDELMQRLARGIVAQQRPNGGFWHLTDPDGEPVPEVTSLFSNGEAFWALLLANEQFPEAGYDQAAQAAATYIAIEQDDEENVLFPPWASQWSAYGYADLVPLGISDAQAAYVDDLINRFGAIIRGGAQQRSGGIADWVRTGSARGSGFGTILEATAAMNRLAQAEPRFAHYQEELRERLVCAAGLVVTGQQTVDVAATYPNPDLVEGAWFVDDLTRMDDQQHHLSGLLATRAFLKGEDF